MYIYCEDTEDQGEGESGGGGSGSSYSTEIVDSTLTDNCYKDVLNLLLGNDANLHVVLQGILPNFGVSESIRVTFQNGNIGGINLDAEMYPASSGGHKKYTIILNDSGLSGAPKEYIAATIIHEVLHAHFHAMGITIDDHENMANLYITPMAQSLVNLFGISVNAAIAMAWGGLTQTSSWLNLPAWQRDIYQATNSHWKNAGNPRSSAPGTICD